jgi:phytol kinase
MGIAASVVSSGVALLSYWLPILPGVDGVGRNSLGTFFYAVSIGVLTAVFWPLGLPQYAALGILVMTWEMVWPPWWGKTLAAIPTEFLVARRAVM